MMHWNPNAMCDGKQAEERAVWLQQNKGMGQHAARNQVMNEFPKHFQGMGGLIGGIFSAVGSALEQGATGWNPSAMCDGTRAEERAIWLQQNEGMSAHAAKERVMREFPAQFGHRGGSNSGMGGGFSGLAGWNPNALCDGTRAEERVLWLQQHEKMSAHAAKERVMREFPSQFGHHGGLNTNMSVGGGGGFPGATGWNPNAFCDGMRAEERVLWLQQNRGMTVEAARSQVMREFPAAFSGAMVGSRGMWNPNAFCDGTRAEERVLWLQQNKGMNTDAARLQVMREFPAAFA
mmetsp:Transcript_119947/g.187339  ORF Transcript_119947/g.187339 Transcript_119947/m.187339 type:complete len:291 (-) Transcript_119947:129-1001(-)